MSDKEFKRALDEADLVVGDGVSVWAAADYLKLGGGKNVLIRLIEGLRVGIKVLRGEYAQRPVGMRMFEKLMAVKKYKIFLFGGFNKVAERLVRKYGGEWSEEDEKVIEKINNYNPDILFVALGRYKQEKWIAKNIYKLKAAVVMGVGSAFDELAGEGVWHKKTPEWIEKMGLKWLWRVVVDPRHVTRAWRAFPVFPWKVFWQSGRK
jgi:N-acetylglucosaminyldiphosphoundecaprenol N-acetyl-beta-D-mannosaminyltransferase